LSRGDSNCPREVSRLSVEVPSTCVAFATGAVGGGESEQCCRGGARPRRGTRRDRSVAPVVAAQLEFTLRRIDVIGEWQRIDHAKELPSDAIVSHGQVWRPGLRFEQVLDGTRDLTMSKNDTDAVFDVTAYTLFMGALQAVPENERAGPLVVDDDSVPIRRRNYQDLYRDVANAAGVPRVVRNMFARHGGVTEAHESGADLVDIGKHAQHRDLLHRPFDRDRHVGGRKRGSRIGSERTKREIGISNKFPTRFQQTRSGPCKFLILFGTAGWTRTTDLLIHSQAL
jgi:hypothetical protein